MTDCIFCKLIIGEIPTNKVYEDDEIFAFLDMTQVTKGHTLVVPKKHVKDIYDYDSELAGKVFSRIPRIATAIEAAFPESKGLNIINNNREVAYQSVFHSHLHLIPRYSTEDDFKMSMIDNGEKYTQEELQEIASKINQEIK